MAADSEPSTPGTPSKRIKISSWATLLAPISNEDRCGLDLTKILDAKIKASVFLMNPIDCQMDILQSALPGQDELVDNIMKCTSNYQPPTLESRIEEYLLPPSKVKKTEVIQVARYIFGTQDLASTSEIKELVTNQSAAVEPAAVESQDSDAEDVACNLVFSQLTDIFNWTHNLAEEEPPGYLPLGNLVVFFGKKLSEALDRTYKCHPQRVVASNANPGQNPSTDVAIVIRLRDSVSSDFVSKVLYEYKTSVNHLLGLVETKDLMELFLQCYYTLKSENQSSILGCLTDLISWHYICLTRNMSKLKVTFYRRLQMDMPPGKTQIASHLSFLVQCLK